MKKVTLVVLSLTAMVGLVGMVEAAPSGVSEIAKNGGMSEIAKTGGSNVSELAHASGSYVGVIAASPVQSVPVPGTLLLFGAGFIALAMWHLHWHRGMTA